MNYILCQLKLINVLTERLAKHVKTLLRHQQLMTDYKINQQTESIQKKPLVKTLVAIKTAQ